MPVTAVEQTFVQLQMVDRYIETYQMHLADPKNMPNWYKFECCEGRELSCLYVSSEHQR